jgi:hypothetical protein
VWESKPAAPVTVPEGYALAAAKWESLTEALVDEYLEDYEMVGEDEQGRDACYTPNDREKALIKDFVMGLFQEAELVASKLAASPQPATSDERGVPVKTQRKISALTKQVADLKASRDHALQEAERYRKQAQANQTEAPWDAPIRPATSEERDSYELVESRIKVRYRVEPTGRGFWPYCVRAGDGTKELFVGHKRKCDEVAAALTAACLDGAFMLAHARVAASNKEPTHG